MFGADFAIVYYRQNKAEVERLFQKAEGPYIAAYSILMLNTGMGPSGCLSVCLSSLTAASCARVPDLHNPRVSRKMKKNEFLDHFGAMLPGLPREYIDGIYDRIRAVELKVIDDASATPTASDAEDKGKGLKGFFSRFF